MDERTVITIGREFGSGGHEIGMKLAEKLGIKCYDKELLQVAAKESGLCEELFASQDEKPTNSFLYSLVMDTYSLGYSNSYVDMPINHKVFLAQFDAIKKLAAKESCVIVGRCADYALEDDPFAVSVWIKASLDERIKRIKKLYELNDSKAADLIQKTDKKRASYYNYYSSKKWGEAKSYDLCIDSGLVGIDGAIDKRIKKKDIKRWFKGSNLIVYVLILLLLLLILLFAFKTIVSMHNDNVSSDSDESADTTEEDTGSTTEESAYIAKNQSYKIRINVSRNIAIIYSINSNNGFDNVVKAFYVSVNSNINTGDTFISEKAEWRKLDITGYGHYSTRLNNSEYICSSAYFTKTVGNMNIDEYNKMGTSASSGSIYMTPADAKWIYNNCGVNTQVQIENDFDIPSSVNITEFKKYNYVDKLEE